MEKKPLLTKEQKLLKQLDKERQKSAASARRAQRIGAQLTKLSRSSDTHRKCVAGAWALGKAERDPEFNAMMMRELNRTLWRDDEREAYGLEKLPEDVKEQRRPKRPKKDAITAPVLVKNTPVIEGEQEAREAK